MKLTQEQEEVALQLCEQFAWLTEHELNEVAQALNFPDTSYGGYTLCQHIAYNNLLSEVATNTRKYLALVKTRQNPPLDKLNEIIAETLIFKSNCFFTSSEELDILCQERFFPVFQKFKAAQTAGGTTSYGYIKRQDNGMNLRDKIKLLVDNVSAQELCRTFHRSGWIKSWIKAIDMITGACEINLWSDGSVQSNIGADRSRILIDREEAIKKSVAGAMWRREGQRARDQESIKQYAADQKAIDVNIEAQKKKSEEYAKHQKEKIKTAEVNKFSSRSSEPIERYNDYRSRNDTGYVPEPRNETERAEESSFIWGNGKRPSFY